VNDIIEAPSLLPYLEKGRNTFYIQALMGQHDESVHERSSFPFLVVSESGPLVRILGAEINTDAGTKIESVFLLTQKDEYHFIEDELWPIDNRAIEQYWQRAFSFHSHEKSGSPPLILKNQIDKNGALLPFGPLLYCKFKQAYFHPLCPNCGRLLQQCYNDDMLQEHGLQPYSGSLKRYLFCPSCTGSKESPDFYVSSKANNDPPFLKSRFDLIKKLGQLKDNTNLAAQLPCGECNNYQECYGPDSLAVSRIVPLSFYPFYMLMFKADSVNALDFLALISGATWQESENQLVVKQQPGRLSCLQQVKRKGSFKKPFFFRDEDRYFPEVLYLKLSFLGELAQAVFLGLDTFRYPDLGLSIDRIWVKLTDQNSLLPSFWNFKLDLLDVIGVDARSLSIPKIYPSYGLHLFGVVWFYTLLVNKKQAVSHVYPVLSQAMREMDAKDDASLEHFLEDNFHHVFAPENIFYHPEIVTVNKKWHEFWKRSLGLGFYLVQGNLSSLNGWSQEKFEKELAKLRQQIKNHLFSPDSFVSTKESEADGKAISNILKKIMNTWQDGLEAPSDELETLILPPETNDVTDVKGATDFQEEEDLEETVILSGHDLDSCIIITPEELEPTDITNDIGLKNGDEMEETIILSSDDMGQDRSPSVDSEADDLPETIILSSDDIGQDRSPSVDSEADDLPETIIISPQQSPSGYPKDPSLEPHSQGAKSEDTEQGGIVPDETMTHKKKKTEKSEHDEFLNETILIRPGEVYPGKKKHNK
jgi:hypothetical protein